MAQKTASTSEIIYLRNLYESALSQYSKTQEIMHNSNFARETSILSVLEEKEIQLGLELEEIENKIIEFRFSDLPERLEYLAIVLDILARRESITEHPLICAMRKCLSNS